MVVLRRKKTEFTRLSREEKGEGIHFDTGPHGKAKAWNGKSYAELSDADCDEALALPDPPNAYEIP